MVLENGVKRCVWRQRQVARDGDIVGCPLAWYFGLQSTKGTDTWRFASVQVVGLGSLDQEKLACTRWGFLEKVPVLAHRPGVFLA
jgi:hypothetical protein